MKIKNMKAIFSLHSRNFFMVKIVPIITTFWMILCLGFSAEETRCVNFAPSDRSESSSEDQRECSVDEKTGRLAQVPNITRQIKTPIPYLNRLFPLIFARASTSTLSLRRDKLSSVSSCSVFSTNVLRI